MEYIFIYSPGNRSSSCATAQRVFAARRLSWYPTVPLFIRRASLVLLCPSAMGMLPLGLTVTAGQSEEGRARLAWTTVSCGANNMPAFLYAELTTCLTTLPWRNAFASFRIWKTWFHQSQCCEGEGPPYNALWDCLYRGKRTRMRCPACYVLCSFGKLTR